MPSESVLDIYKFLKIYPDFTRLYHYKITESDLCWFLCLPKTHLSYKLMRKESFKHISIDDSIRRTKTVISDLFLCNKFDMFVSFTFDCQRCIPKCENTIDNIDKNIHKPCTCIRDKTHCTRYDIDLCKTRMSKWLKNQRELHGNFNYLIVPEFHKDGAIHFHALLGGYTGATEVTNDRNPSKPLYAIKSYRLGLSSLKYIDQSEQDYRKVASYIKKYISKEMPIFKDKKRYWCSKGLKRPLKIGKPELTPWDEKDFVHVYDFKKISLYESPKTDYLYSAQRTQDAKLMKLFTTVLSGSKLIVQLQLQLQN